MNWSNEWPKPQNSLPFVEKIDNEYIWTKLITLSLIINEGDFPTTIEAIQVGDLAVHCNLRKEGYWQVTHVPTLTRFNAILNGLHKQADLIAWCKKVQSRLPEDWKELAQLTHECYKERSAAKDRIMYLCQGMEVTSTGE